MSFNDDSFDPRRMPIGQFFGARCLTLSLVLATPIFVQLVADTTNIKLTIIKVRCSFIEKTELPAKRHHSHFSALFTDQNSLAPSEERQLENLTCMFYWNELDLFALLLWDLLKIL